MWVSKSYIELYNPFHDRLGRFTFKRGSVNVSKKGLEKTTGAKTRPTEEVKKWVSAHKRELVEEEYLQLYNPKKLEDEQKRSEKAVS